MKIPMSIFSVLLTGSVTVMFITCFLLLASNLYQHCKTNKATKKLLALTYSAMASFTLSLLFGTIQYILLTVFADFAQHINIITVCVYIFYGAGLMMMMYVWVERIEVTFQNSFHSYSDKTLRNLRILYFATAYTCFQCFATYAIVHTFRLNRYHILVWISSAIFALSFAILSIILIYCFLQKLAESITTAKVVSATVAKKITVGQHLVVLHAKFSILSTLSITSTFFALVGVIVLDVIVPMNSDLYHYMWQFPVFCDNMIVFFSLFCALVPNKKYYFAVFGCWHSRVMKKRNAMFGTQTLLEKVRTPELTTAATSSTVTMDEPEANAVQSSSQKDDVAAVTIPNDKETCTTTTDMEVHIDNE